MITCECQCTCMKVNLKVTFWYIIFFTCMPFECLIFSKYIQIILRRLVPCKCYQYLIVTLHQPWSLCVYLPFYVYFALLYHSAVVSLHNCWNRHVMNKGFKEALHTLIYPCKRSNYLKKRWIRINRYVIILHIKSCFQYPRTK